MFTFLFLGKEDTVPSSVTEVKEKEAGRYSADTNLDQRTICNYYLD